MTKIHPAEFDGNATTTSTTDNGDDAHVLSGADDGDASPNAISAMEKNEMPVENSNVSGSNGERFHEASPPNNDQVRYEMNDAFFDSSGVVHDGETFSYFDAMEVLYFDNMLYQQQSPLDRQSPQLLARELPFETQKVAAIDENEEEEQEHKSIAHKIKGRVDAKQKNLRKLARQQRETLERSIHARRKKMKKMISDPGFVMTMDKISFVLGVVTIMTIELVLLLIPDQMGMLYTALLLPLMVARYIIYRADLYHYFMYDFCYFSQLLMLLQMYVYPNNIRFSKALFSIANGPLALAVVMWRNSLVFHSMDKMTSMFIHVLPPLVMFSRRWGEHIFNRNFPLYEKLDGTWSSNIIDFWLNPFCYYVLWQTIYLFKTEVISKKKLCYNSEIMTSLRWLTRKRDSASYKLLSIFGEDNQLPTFVFAQAVYTVVTFLVVPLLWHSFWLHAAYLMVIFIVALVNGAKYYFHVFAVRYIEEIGKRVSEEKSDGNAAG